MKCLLLALFMALILIAAPVLAQPPRHIGDYCVACHSKFYSEEPDASNLSLPVKNLKVTRIVPCYKSACHGLTSDRRRGRPRYEIHINEKICMNCHSGKDGKFDVHSIHTKFGTTRTPVECKTCHRLPEGYNSSLAHVPAYDKPYIADSTLMNTSMRTPPWNGDCGYCHPSVAGARRLHDVHEPVLQKVCIECHGKEIESRTDLIVKVTQGAVPEKKNAEGKSIIVQVLVDIFEEMAGYILKVMS